MATISPTVEATSGGQQPHFIRLLWETVTEADTAQSIDVRAQSRRVSRSPAKVDQIVSAGGTFGGVTVSAEQSDDNVNWFAAKNPADTAITFTGAGSDVLRDDYPYFRFTVAGGTGQDVDLRYSAKFASSRT